MALMGQSLTRRSSHFQRAKVLRRFKDDNFDGSTYARKAYGPIIPLKMELFVRVCPWLHIFQERRFHILFILKGCNDRLHKRRQVIRFPAGDQLSVYSHFLIYPVRTRMDQVVLDGEK